MKHGEVQRQLHFSALSGSQGPQYSTSAYSSCVRRSKLNVVVEEASQLLGIAIAVPVRFNETWS